MDILLIFSGFIFACLVALLYEYRIRLLGKQRNNVHFYVARDKDEELYFYPTKPIRRKYCFIPNYDKDTAFTFKGFNGHCLSTKNFDNLKWEDEPVEVFLNLED